MTNGGGVTEQKKAESLSGILSNEATILGEQMLLCHTPMQELTSSFKDDLILLVGKNNSRAIMSAYGFNNTITVDELHAQFPSLHAESPVTPAEPIEAFRKPIKAVFCLLDPQDYLRDLQIVTDVLRSDDGVVGTLKSPGAPQMPLFFSCYDFEYVTEWPVPRFGAGVFCRALEGLYTESTGETLQSTVYGKPLPTTYRHAEHMLHQQAQKLGYSTVRNYFGIGDNPLSDIKGVIDSGHPWQSYLVSTGMYEGGVDSNDPHHPADFVVHSVVEAVNHIIDNELELRNNQFHHNA
jgi:HAD superfamily hydrolase (TIGR01456 family)